MNSFQVSFPRLVIHDLEINRIAFTLELFGKSIPVYWYGLVIMLGFLLALFLAYRHSKSYGLKADDILDVFLFVVPSSIIGARLYYVLFSWDDFKGNLSTIFDIRQGGLAFYGGVLAGVLAVYLVAKYKKIPVYQFFDFFVPYLALGQAIGRWGNFFNQEAFGVSTNLPWGMISDGTVSYLQSINYPYANSPVHPTFLYESLGNILIFAILMYRRKRSKTPYEITALYFLMYGALRFGVEGLRTDSLYIGSTNIRSSQLLSALMFAGSLAYLLYILFKEKDRVLEKEEESIDQQ